ncbi:MAG: T9SS type A sorting domain-containing protein, partial [Bacteroidales bacterium]|nr:T9SS type A sorting domain-containing protein [Bacteroidales bacterium]
DRLTEVGNRSGGNESVFVDHISAPMSKGAFVYRTVPLPIHLTKGKTSIAVFLRSTGVYNAYGTVPVQGTGGWSGDLYQEFKATDFVKPEGIRHTYIKFVGPDSRTANVRLLTLSTGLVDRLQEKTSSSIDVQSNGRQLLVSGVSDRTRIEVFNISGVNVSDAANTALEPGFYLVRVVDGSEQLVSKIYIR